MTTTVVDIAALIAGGTHWACRNCSGVIRVANRTCPHCSHVRPAPPATTPTPCCTKTTNPVNRQLSAEAKGGLSCLPDETLWLIVKGSPITQGSMRALAPGVMKHDKSGELNRWRNSISQALLMRCGSDWTRVTAPVRLDVVFTLPATPAAKGAAHRIFPAVSGRSDNDKLLRAVQDALSPKLRKGEASTAKLKPARLLSRFQLLADDSYVVDSHPVKTYPRPWHTHSWALDVPGVVIRICPADSNAAALPLCSITEPGPFPAQAERSANVDCPLP